MYEGYDMIYEKKTCPYCNKDFIDIEGRSFSSHSKWCMKGDLAKDIIRNQLRSKDVIDNTYGKLLSIEVSCNKCNRKFHTSIREKMYKFEMKFYCSRSCANSRVHSIDTKKKISKSCSISGLEYYRNHPEVLDRLSIRASNRVSDPKDKFAKRVRMKLNYNGYVFKSNWELKFANVLDYFKLVWSYESRRFPYNHKGIIRNYTPDFFIEGLGYIEIKPIYFIDELTKLKLKAVIDSGESIYLMTEYNWNFLINKISKLKKIA